MADKYPWGAQAPAPRLAKLEQTLASSQRERERLVEAHQRRLGELDEADRQTRVDIRMVSTILQRERRDEEIAGGMKLFEKLVANSKLDVGSLLKSGALEKALADALSVASAAEQASGKKEKAKGAEAGVKQAKPAKEDAGSDSDAGVEPALVAE